jgi:hypothetical protein
MKPLPNFDNPVNGKSEEIQAALPGITGNKIRKEI